MTAYDTNYYENNSLTFVFHLEDFYATRDLLGCNITIQSIRGLYILFFMYVRAYLRRI